MAELVLRPSWRFVRRHPAHFIAFGGGIGLVPFAPGTWGTLLAVPLYWIANRFLAPAEFLVLVCFLFGLGIWACEVTGRAIGSSDHGGMVWDETVAFLLVLFLVPAALAWQAAAFVLFRLIDIVKPQPIRYYEKRFRSGFGVMLDDFVAAFFTLVVLAIAKIVIEALA